VNPYAFVILLVGALALVVAWKGSQDNVAAAALGKPFGTSTLSATS
jgi:hypothetical protein